MISIHVNRISFDFFYISIFDQVIKFQAWEGEFEKRINEIRDREMALFKRWNKSIIYLYHNLQSKRNCLILNQNILALLFLIILTDFDSHHLFIILCSRIRF